MTICELKNEFVSSCHQCNVGGRARELNHGQKSWDSCTVRTLCNTREIVSARY